MSRPFTVRVGRLVAVRLRGEELQVALVTPEGLRWVRPEAVLSAIQAEQGTHVSTFEVDNRSGQHLMAALPAARYQVAVNVG